MAKNPSDFWRRWHISLSSWLKDYLYIPLGGNRHGKIITYRNLMLTMLLGGLWHGAAWTFVLWGLYHGLLLAVHRMLKPAITKFTANKGRIFNTFFKVISIAVMFHLTCAGWLIFRGESLGQIWGMLAKIFTQFGEMNYSLVLEVQFYGLILAVIQVLQYVSGDLLFMYHRNPVIKAVFYFFCFILLIMFGVYGAEEFIYFQF